jgi:ElaB/YqjD/DUF883 family membrane-anchored ribosome-binding protein
VVKENVMPDMFGDLTDKVGDTFSNGKSSITSRARHAIEDATHRAGELARNAGSRASSLASAAKGQVTSKATSFGGLVKAHPYAFVAGAAGLALGVLIAMRLRR